MDINLPLVSIVIPVFNRQNYIDDCIQSCLDQTYSNIEIVIYDNCSNDKTFLIAKGYEQKNNNVRVYKQEKNVGPVLNWLSAIKVANGKYLKILFSDDIIYPNFISETLSKFSSEIGFVISSFNMGENEKDSIIQNDWHGIDGEIDSNRYIHCAIKKFAFCVSPGAALYRTKDVLEVFEIEIASPTLKNFKSHGAGPDLLIYLKIAVRYKKIYKINRSLTFFRYHKNSQTIKMNRSNNGLIQSCYMQARVYFCENYYKKLFGQSLGKALFVELLQNRKISCINIIYLTKLYTLSNEFSLNQLVVGFLNAVKYATLEISRRLFYKMRY